MKQEDYDFFKENGYLVLEEILSDDDVGWTPSDAAGIATEDSDSCGRNIRCASAI